MQTAVAGAGFSPLFVCVCLSPHGISQKLMQLRSPILTYKMFHHKFSKPIYFGVKGQKSRLQVTKTVLAFVFALL